jgi:hypothetical protein
LEKLDTDDVLLVTRRDRLARSTRDLLNTLAAIAAKGATFRSLGDAWAHGARALDFDRAGWIAEFEREPIRIGEGRAFAVANGVKLGRKPTLSPPEPAVAAPKKWRGKLRASRSSPASSLQGRRRGMTIFAASVRKLVGENVHATDFRLLDEQLGRSGHQLLRELALQMGLPTMFVRESVEYAESAVSHPDREPGRRLRLLVDHRSGARQKGRDLLLHSGLGFELDVKRMVRHLASPLVTPTKIAKAEVRLY